MTEQEIKEKALEALKQQACKGDERKEVLFDQLVRELADKDNILKK